MRARRRAQGTPLSALWRPKQDGNLNRVDCECLEGWDEVGGGREGTSVCLWLTHVDVWQKPTQYCKTIILKLNMNPLKKRKKSGYRFMYN